MPIPNGDHSAWWNHPLQRMYQSLTRDDAPAPADLIFVHAGRMERKQYGIDLFRQGIAPRLLLSVGRFEISRMSTIGFAGADALIAQRDRTPPGERHFFCEMNASGIRIERVRLRRWSTYGEVLELHEYLHRGAMPRSMIVVSTDVHLRRVALAFDKVFGRRLPETRYCPVPDRYSFLKKETWWSGSEGREFVVKETVKLAGYRTILAMPEWAIRKLMRLK